MCFNRLLMTACVFLLVPFAWSQVPPPAATAYDPRLSFAPLTLPNPVNAYRSSNGAPGPAYWQNEADYEMHAELDTAARCCAKTKYIPKQTIVPTPPAT